MRGNGNNAYLDQRRHDQRGDSDVDSGRRDSHAEYDRRKPGQDQQDQQLPAGQVDHGVGEFEPEAGDKE